MSPHLATAAAAYAILIAVAAGWRAVRPLREAGALGAPLLASCLVLELVLSGRAIAALLAVAGGARPAETTVWACYLVLSVALIPVGVRYAMGGDGGRADSLVLAVVALAAAVVTLRLQATWAE